MAATTYEAGGTLADFNRPISSVYKNRPTKLPDNLTTHSKHMSADFEPAYL